MKENIKFDMSQKKEIPFVFPTISVKTDNNVLLVN